MITSELFLIANLVTGSPVSYWWVVLFLLSDWQMWGILREIFAKGKKKA